MRAGARPSGMPGWRVCSTSSSSRASGPASTPMPTPVRRSSGWRQPTRAAPVTTSSMAFGSWRSCSVGPRVRGPWATSRCWSSTSRSSAGSPRRVVVDGEVLADRAELAGAPRPAATGSSGWRRRDRAGRARFSGLLVRRGTPDHRMGVRPGHRPDRRATGHHLAAGRPATGDAHVLETRPAPMATATRWGSDAEQRYDNSGFVAVLRPAELELLGADPEKERVWRLEATVGSTASSGPGAEDADPGRFGGRPAGIDRRRRPRRPRHLGHRRVHRPGPPPESSGQRSSPSRTACSSPSSGATRSTSSGSGSGEAATAVGRRSP